MSGTRTERIGDAWVFTWPELDYRITLDRVHENGDGMHADLLIETAEPLKSTGRRGHIHWSRLNLGWAQGRGTLVKSLATQTKRAPEIWQELLEYAVVECRDAFRAGEPVVDLATISPRLTVPHLVEPLIPEGETSLIMADGESGKSWLALTLAITVRLGCELKGVWKPTRACPVLYIDYETGQTEVRRRLELLCRGLGLTEIPHIHYIGLQRGLAEEIGRLRKEIDRYEIGLVILDSIGPATAGDLVEGASVIRTMNALRSLRVTRMVLAHVSRQVAQQNNGRGYAYGSIFYENLSRSVWELRKDEEGGSGALGLFHRKSNMGPRHDPIGVKFIFDDAGKRVTPRSADVLIEPQLAQYAPLRLRVLTALRDGAKSIKTLSDDLDTPESTLRSLLRRMPEVIQIGEASRGRNASPALWGLKSKREN